MAFFSCIWGYFGGDHYVFGVNLELEFEVFGGDIIAGLWMLFSLCFGLIFTRVLVWKQDWFMDCFRISLVVLSWP